MAKFVVLVASPAMNGGPMEAGERVGRSEDLPPGEVTGAGRWAVGNADGTFFALTRRCRHLGVDLAGGHVDGEGCLVCPWHGSRYDPRTGRMVEGPRGAFAKVPGLGASLKALTRVAPLGVGRVEERDGTLFVHGASKGPEAREEG